MSYKDQPKHVFPRRINRQLPARPRQKVASIHKQQKLDWANPQNRIKYQNFPNQQKRNQSIKQRQQMISYSGKISADSPDWWRSTLEHSRKSQMPRIKNTIDLLENRREGNQNYDVFNRKRDSYMTVKNARMESLYNNKSVLISDYPDNKSSMMDSRSSNRSMAMRFNRSEVSPKVGSLDIRDYSIRKPVLKIGSNNYVDTYSIF